MSKRDRWIYITGASAWCLCQVPDVRCLLGAMGFGIAMFVLFFYPSKGV